MRRMGGLIMQNVTLLLYTSRSHGICLHARSQIRDLVLLKLIHSTVSTLEPYRVKLEDLEGWKCHQSLETNLEAVQWNRPAYE